MNLSWQEAYKQLLEKLQGWIEAGISMLPNLVLAIVVLIIFYIIGRFVRNVVKRLLHKITNNKTIIGLLETIAGIMVIGAGVFSALGILQLDGTVKSLLAGAGIIGLALGFAFRDIAANLMSGIILSVRHPFGIGDMIECQDHYGYVHKVNLRCTVIRTTQGQLVYLPNKDVMNSPFINYTWNNERRVDISIGVSYADDHEKVREVTIETVKGLDKCKKDRPVQLYYTGIGGSTFNYTLRFWVDFAKNPDFLSPRSEAIIAIGKAYEEHDIDMSYPIRTLDFGVKGGVKLDEMLRASAANGNGTPKGDGESE